MSETLRKTTQELADKIRQLMEDIAKLNTKLQKATGELETRRSESRAEDAASESDTDH